MVLGRGQRSVETGWGVRKRGTELPGAGSYKAYGVKSQFCTMHLCMFVFSIQEGFVIGKHKLKTHIKKTDILHNLTPQSSRAYFDLLEDLLLCLQSQQVSPFYYSFSCISINDN